MFNASRTRGICPSCGSRQVIHILYGLPAHPDAEPPWVRIGGCVIDGEPTDRECSDCGHVWSFDRPDGGLTPQQQMLCEYVLSIGGTRPSAQPDGRVHFDMHGVPARVRVKEGGARIRGTVEIAEVDDESRAVAWLSMQPQPQTAELMVWRRNGGGDVMRLVWERPIHAVRGIADPIAIETGAYVTAWRNGTEVSLDPVEFEPSDPRDVAPEQAWLLFGDDASWPTMDELEEQHESGDAGIFEPVWTAAKQTQVGDLLLIYFGGSRKEVHFVARAASPAFYTSNILAGLGLEAQGVENDYMDLPAKLDVGTADPAAVPNPGDEAVSGLKFSAALPIGLATRTLGQRLADPGGAIATLAQTIIHAR